MYNLTFERIWEDADFFEIEVTAQSPQINASMKLYTMAEYITELALNLQKFPPNLPFNQVDKYIWDVGAKEDGSPPYLSLSFWCEDKLGHIVIEVFMKVADGALYDKYNCCFFVKTEIGLLNEFGKALLSLNEKGTGQKAVLCPH